MTRFESSMRAIGERLRSLLRARRQPLTWHMIDKLENLEEQENSQSMHGTGDDVKPIDDAEIDASRKKLREK